VSEPIRSRPDHVAIAVPDPEAARPRWGDRLGGGEVNHFDSGAFRGLQFRYANRAKLEVLGPSPSDPSTENFLRRFLDRYGPSVHHLTLLVPDLRTTIERLGAADLEVVDVREVSPHWHEAFLRPSQVGGLVVQVAETDRELEDWAAVRGLRLEEPAAGAAALLGPRLRHPDLERAAWLWTILGADVGQTVDGLLCAWEGSPLTVLITEGEPAGPVCLRMTGTPDLPDDGTLGPAVEGAEMRA
jgi:catechol 2,3-dioxygenase-like lactoylglutathione lyase family enzyme